MFELLYKLTTQVSGREFFPQQHDRFDARVHYSLYAIEHPNPKKCGIAVCSPPRFSNTRQVFVPPCQVGWISKAKLAEVYAILNEIVDVRYVDNF